MTSLILNTTNELTSLIELTEQAKEFAEFSKSSNTKKAYNSDWKDFVYWCNSKGLSSLPANPECLAVYLSDRASNQWTNAKGQLQYPLKISSLRRRLSAITQAHLSAQYSFDLKNPILQEVWKGIKNVKGISQDAKEPILIDDLRKMIEVIPVSRNNPLYLGITPYLAGIRDRAMLLLGFSGAFRRSELVSIQLEDLMFLREGLIVFLSKSKTDQEGKGREVPIPYGSNILTCPVRSLQDWLAASGITNGPIFRPINKHGQIQPKSLTSHSVALIIKRNEHIMSRKNSFSGHSLRAGFVTTAAIANVPEHSIMKQTGHKKSDTLKKYIRISERWRDNAASRLGL